MVPATAVLSGKDERLQCGSGNRATPLRDDDTVNRLTMWFLVLVLLGCALFSVALFLLLGGIYFVVFMALLL